MHKNKHVIWQGLLSFTNKVNKIGGGYEKNDAAKAKNQPQTAKIQPQILSNLTQKTQPCMASDTPHQGLLFCGT